MIFTFYSFKGGVGRSMMLANAAELLYQRGLNVLMIDFDLEAPGLERFFSSAGTLVPDNLLAAGLTKVPEHAELVRARGVLDLLISYKALRAMPVPITATVPSEPSETAAEGGTMPAAPGTVFPYQVEPLKNFIVPIRGPTTEGGGSLWLMPAGRRDDNEYSLYADRVRAFDWEDFYAQWNGAQFFEWFGDELRNAYDVVLIDSRTGITEMSGVCTHQLADAVVLFVAANEQNLEGTRRMAESLSRKELVESRRGRKLPILIVPSRVELAEGLKLKQFSDRFADLATMIDGRITFRTSAFLDLRVPYIPFYAFGENVAVREPDLPISADLNAATARICSAMFELIPKESANYIRYQAAQANLASPAVSVSFEKPPSDFVGREWLFAEIGKWLRQPSPPTMLIIGGAGTGKTAVAARLVASATEAGMLPGSLRLAGQLLFAYSCQREAGWRPFVEALARALAARWPQFAVAVSRAASTVPAISVRVQQRIGTVQQQGSAVDLSLDSVSIGDVSGELAFRVLLRQPLEDIARSGGLRGPALIVIDALDEALSSDDDNLPDLLAAATMSGWPPPGLKLLILSRADPRVLQITPSTILELHADPTRAQQDIAAYVELRLVNRMPAQERRVVIEQITDLAQGNFLYARLVLDALLANAKDTPDILANVDRVLRSDRIPDSLHKLYIGLIQHAVGFNMERWAQRCRPFVGVLSVAPEGFTLNQLAGISRRSRTEVADSLRLLSSLLIGPSASGHFRLFHSSFATFLLNDLDYGMSAVEAREMIANYFLTQYHKQWTRDADPEAVRDTDRHLMQAARETQDRWKRSELLDRLAGLVLEPSFVEAKLAADARSDLLAAISTVLELAPDHARTAELQVLKSLIEDRANVLSRLRSDPGWLPAEINARTGAVPTGLAPAAAARGTPVTAEPTPAKAPKPGPQLDEEALRQQIPVSVRIALNVWSRAKTSGAILLTNAIVLCGALVAGAMFRGINYYVSNMFSEGAWLGLYCVVLLGALYLLYVAWYDRGGIPASLAESTAAAAPPGWEILPEVIALRARRAPYHLFGGIAVASPYFEVTLVIFTAAAVMASVSPLTTPIRPFLRMFGLF
jgi:hypothetical protein